MKTILTLIIRSSRLNWVRRALLAASLLAFGAMSGQNARAADIQWTNAAGSWTNVVNWLPHTVPGSGDNAVFNTSAITGNPNVTCNVSPANSLQVGSITVGDQNGSVFRISANSQAVNPTTLNLNGVGGILLSNYSTLYQVLITNATVSPFNALNLGLANSGVIYANTTASPGQPPLDNSGGQITIGCSITGPGSITNVGPGILSLYTNNTYSGSTTLNAGSLSLGGGATIGDGTGTLYLSGGNLLTRGSSTTRIISNPIVVNTAGKAYIYNQTGTAGTRVFAFSGSLTGISGTLAIVNLAATANEFLDVQLRGSFTFGLPLIVGDTVAYWSDNYPSDYSILQLANSSATGAQTFNGDISGDGAIYRGSLPNVVVSGANGASIFTGNNTYSGGTIINNGTLFANNATGSALGSGAVTVTNAGTLGGNGTVVAQTAVSLNGTISPGATSNGIANLAVSDLTFSPGAIYNWQIASATGTPGTDWDLITCSSSWTDAGSSGNPITIKLDSLGVSPTGWSSGTARDWVIVSSGVANSFDSSHFTVDSTSSFSGAVAGGFNVYVSGGALHLTYTPGSDFIINVPSGSQGQTAGYGTITGATNVVKVGNGEIVFDNSANSYSGQTKILAGTLSLTVNAPNGSGALGANTSATLLGNTTGNSNATLNISVNGVTDGHGVIVQSGSSGTKTIGTTLTSGTATFAGDVKLNDNATLNAAAGGSALFGGDFSGAGGIAFTGGGAFTMAGVGSYSGTTTLPGGTLNLNANALGTNTFTISGPSTLDNTGAGSVTLNSCPQNWNADFSFTGTASLNLGAGPVTMSSNRTVTANNNTLTVGGTIAGTGFGLTKAGAGTLALAATNAYTGGTTNLAGVLAINGTATFGDGTGPLVLAGGNLLNTGSRAGSPIANPVQMTTSTRIYGNSTDTASPNRFLPFTGVFTVTGGSSLYIDNIGSATTIFNVSLQGGNYTTINWPIVIGDSGFDTSGALTVLNLINDNTTPIQTISSLISGTGSIIRGASAVNTGGTTILTQQNTFSGGVALDAGAIGLGANSITNGGGMVSGPLGTGQFTFGAQTAEASLTVFATVPNVEIDNKLFFNGDTNMVFAGINNMRFTGDLNSGGIAKTITVTNGITVTLSGAITNTGSSGGGAITKAGGGILVLSGASTYIGTTTINAGTLLVNGSIGGTNIVAVNSGGTLGGKGTIGIAGISLGVNFASGAQAYLYKSAGSPDSPLTIASNLTLNGNTVIVDLGGTTTLGPGSYRLINYAGSLSGSFNPTPTLVNGSLAGGNAATIDLSTANQVNLVVAPGSSTPPNFPPGSIGQLPSGNFSLTATGAIGGSYRLWATTNLALKPVTNTWTLLNSGTITVSPFTNYDLTATNYPQRFYLFTTP